MKENTNTIIIFNTMVLYIRLFLVLVCGLLSTRFALKALGVADFGLFAVVGSIVTFINIVNATMMSTSNRFLATAIGKNDTEETCKLFNVNFTIHFSMAVLTLLIAIPAGLYYIDHFIHYDGNLNDAKTVFLISLFASTISFIGISYNSLLIAKERFYVFCIPDMLFWMIRTYLCYLLIDHFSDKLMIYALTVSGTVLFPVVINIIYCRAKFFQLVKPKLVRDKKKYREIVVFSAWVGYGGIVQIGREQCAPIFLNLFFNTLMNAAFAISIQIKNGILNFSSNISKPISPQITKNYVAGNFERCSQLMVSSSKFSYLVMFAITSPFLVNPNYILSLWLDQVPEYAASFTRLVIIDCLINTLNMGIGEYVFASGKIKAYQIWTNTTIFLSIIISFALLHFGASAISLLYVYICATSVAVVIRQYILHKEFNFDNMILIKGSYLPSATVTILFLPAILFGGEFSPMPWLVCSVLYSGVLVYLIGLSKSEKGFVLDYIRQKFSKR